jgi:glycosyltransferase involved in cell wall biosynthesis
MGIGAPVKKRIVFLINSIGAGGAERVLDHLLRASGIRAERYDVHLVLLDQEPEERTLPDFPTKHVLDGRGGLTRSAWQLRRLLRRLKPDLCVSFLVRANICNVLAAPLGMRTILCERMHLSLHIKERYSGLRLRIARLIPWLLYRRADLVLGVSHGVRRDLINAFGVPENKARTIYNPYDIRRIEEEAQFQPEMSLPSKFMISSGRLVPGKNFDMLIEAYRRSGVTAPLIILGDGPERRRLEDQISASGLGGRVRLAGFHRNPFPAVARASVFILASRTEGFPNAVAEAMALGVPVIATDCPSGPAELLGGACSLFGPSIVEAEGGLLVRNADCDALTEALQLLQDSSIASRLASAGRLRIQKFETTDISNQYWRTFEEFL